MVSPGAIINTLSLYKYSNCPSSGHGTPIRPEHSLSMLSHLIGENLKYDLIQGQWCMLGLPVILLLWGTPCTGKQREATMRWMSGENLMASWLWCLFFGVVDVSWFQQLFLLIQLPETFTKQLCLAALSWDSVICN